MTTETPFFEDVQAHYDLNDDFFALFLDESRTFFEELVISDDLLAGVETLCFDAGQEIYRQCAPAWDGEDDLFDIRSLDDLALLPNLKRVTAVDDGTLVAPGRWETFAARGIEAS